MRKRTTIISKSIFILRLPVFAGGLLGCVLSASGAEPADTIGMYLEDVEVSGTRLPNAVTSVSPVQNIGAGKILTAGITDISDAIRRLAGVNLRDYGGAGGLKTVSVRGLGAQHTGVLYDGVPLGDSRSGQIDLARYSVDNLNALRLNIGDNDDIFIPARATATASSLSLSTFANNNVPEAGPILSAGIKGGSFGLVNPWILAGGSDGERFAATVTANFIHADNNYPFTVHNGTATVREHRTNSNINSFNGELNGIWAISSSATLNAKIYGYDSYRRLPGPVIYYASPSNERLHDRNYFGQLHFSTSLSPKVSVQGIFKYNWSATAYRDENGKYPGGALDDNYIQQEEYVAAGVLYTPVRSLGLSYSADFFHNSMRDNTSAPLSPIRNSFLQTISAKYSIWRIVLTARALLSLYHDRAPELPDGKTESRISPSLGFSFRPLESVGWYLRASYKSIFRMPTFSELYFDHYGSVNLNPETTEQFNLGTTFDFPVTGPLERLSVTADSYFNTVRNKIVAVPYNMFVMTMTNLGKALITGVDITLDADIHIARRQTLLLSGNYSYQRAMPRTSRDMTDWGKQIAYTPLNSGAWSLAWMNPWVNVSVHGSGCSARYTTNNNIRDTRISGYMEVGMALFRKFRLGKHSLELRADLLNALGKQYEIVARYPMPGRSWQCSAKFSF